MIPDVRFLRWPERDREDYERLAAALARVRAAAAKGRGEIVAPLPTGPEEPTDADRARALLAQRRTRDELAGPLAELFGEPGWDLLLTLFVAFEEDRLLDREELAAAVPLRPPVLARWIDVLTSRGLIGVVGRERLSLSEDGLGLVLRCLGGV